MGKNPNPFVAVSNVFLRTQKDEREDNLEKSKRNKKSRIMRNSFPDAFGQIVAKTDLKSKISKYIFRLQNTWLKAGKRSGAEMLFFPHVKSRILTALSVPCVGADMSVGIKADVFSFLKHKFKLLPNLFLLHNVCQDGTSLGASFLWKGSFWNSVACNPDL